MFFFSEETSWFWCLLFKSSTLWVICLLKSSFSPAKRSSGTKLLVAGPPTRSSGSIALTVLTVAAYKEKYWDLSPSQKPYRLGSFHTSKYHVRTSAAPYRRSQWWMSRSINSHQPSRDFGRRNVCFPPELRSASAFQAGRKEAQLDERTNVQIKQRIK